MTTVVTIIIYVMMIIDDAKCSKSSGKSKFNIHLMREEKVNYNYELKFDS